jgi:hypothetical protein
MKPTFILLAALLLPFGAWAQNEDTHIFCPFEKEPEFPGGMEALYNYLGEKLRYPEEALDYHIEGKIYATFVVDSLGYIRNPRILLGLPGGCNQAALNAIKHMPRWEPGRQHRDGKWVPVDVQFNLPVNFSLAGDTISPRHRGDVVDDTLLPSYPGGTGALYRYLAGTIDRPREEWVGKESPRIDLDSLGNVTEVRRLGASPMDSTIHQALLRMPRWHVNKDHPIIHGSNIPMDLSLLLSMRDTLLRPHTLRIGRYDDDTWARLLRHESYFRALLSVDDSLAAGFHVPASRLQALMPRDRETFLVLFSLDDYNTSYYFPVIYDTMASLALADSLDMMDRFLALLQWSDGWVSEFLFDYAIKIDRQHPKKFRKVMRKYKKEWEEYQEYKKALEEWESGIQD